MDKETAIRLNRNTYLGNPCAKGHNGERYIGKGACVHCERERPRKPETDQDRARKAQWKRDHPEAVKAEHARYRARKASEHAAWVAERKARQNNRRVRHKLLTDLAYAMHKLSGAHERATKRLTKAERTRAERSAIARRYTKQWKRDHPEAYRANARLKRQRRQERERAAGRLPSLAVRMAILEQQGRACAYCQATEQLELDHKIPVVSGGTNAAANLQWLCRLCNNLKRATPDAEYRAANGIKPDSAI